MDVKELKSYSNYNLYANGLIADLLKSIPIELLEKEIENSFPSIIKTLCHNWDAEYVWMTRLNKQPFTTFPSENFEGNAYEIIEEMLKTSTAFNEYVQNQNGETLSIKLPIKTSKGFEFEQSRYQMIHHCINHSTQHRGQLITMCRQVGIREFKPLDYIWYLRNLNQ